MRVLVEDQQLDTRSLKLVRFQRGFRMFSDMKKKTKNFDMSKIQFRKKT
jgi:hypothetical protein